MHSYGRGTYGIHIQSHSVTPTYVFDYSECVRVQHKPRFRLGNIVSHAFERYEHFLD